MQWLQRMLHKHADIVLIAMVLGVLLILFTPIPSGLLDFCILVNFSFAFLILLLTFYMQRPVEFSTFPSLLLIATLFRLSLNVAATRLILTDGDAGRVIGAVGAHVVGANYVIGLIIFLILIVVQYVVVTNGAQRVSEVAARFTLDSMPGQQMSIDADLNMGFIDQAEAQKRRKTIEREAGFYGAMDGASKFVKGDAIAGILIMLINIIGGLVIGIMQRGLPWDEALRTYTLLTIGDGIVTQVPALVIAVGTGIIVTRSASDQNLSAEVLRQMTSFPKTLLIVCAALFALLFLPGLPIVPLGGLLIVFGGVTWLLYRQARQTPETSLDGTPTDAPSETSEAVETSYAHLTVDPIEVAVGGYWAELIKQPEIRLMDRVAAFRKQHAEDIGMVLPRIRFKDSAKLPADRYEIWIDGVLTARGEVRPDRLLAIHPSGDTRALPGEPTRDPTYGLPALWIEESQREAALASRFTLVDPPTVLLTHLTEVLRRESATLLTRAETEQLLAVLRERQPTLVEELIPTVLGASDVHRVLQNLLREKVSIRHVGAILETLADHGRVTKDVALLTEAVRQRLGPAICQSLLGDASTLQVLTLDPALESQFMGQVRGGSAAPVMVEPALAEQVITRLAQHAERMMKQNLLPILLCAPELRRHLRSLSERVIPHLRVLAMTEIPRNIELKSYGVVNV